MTYYAAIHKETGDHHFVASLDGMCPETYNFVELAHEPTEDHRFDGKKLVHEPLDKREAILNRMTRGELVDYILELIRK